MNKILFSRDSVKQYFVLLILFSLLLTKNAFAIFTIPPKPLFLANDVQANIFFALDDSGSMDSEVLNTDEANAALESLIPFNSIFGAVLGSLSSGSSISPLTSGLKIWIYAPPTT